MKGKLTALALVVVALAGSVFAGPIGAAAAQDAGNDTLEDATVSVSEDTRAILVTAENATAELDVSISGVDNESESEVDTATLDATNNGTDSYEYSGVDPETYGEYRVVVNASDGESAETINVEKVEVVPGGGGLIGGSSSLSMIGALAAVIGAGVLYVRQQK